MIRITLESLLKDRKITRYELAKRTGIHYHIIDNYYKNKVVRYDSFILNKICIALKCNIEDIIKFENED
ncbi:MAG: helix-turn-helix transcriptional regulator [Clostridia bacterium]|nr:helix-turn-helix transcriptional regulator [Clostridia bacterium]